MKIYTKKGDDGTTALLGGSRVPKHHLRVEAYGTLDELNSFVGLLSDELAALERFNLPEPTLKAIQDRLFAIGSHVAVDDAESKAFRPDLTPDDLQALERSIDAMTSALPELKHFILPGGHRASSLAHVCRTICRRAERLGVALAEQAHLETQVLPYLNRLSDWFFVLARYVLHHVGAAEVKWMPRGQ